eukprot:CAMPEP_0179192576 /NCGR_PEP_ID=MMETSP0796-20121207/95686_1 /TAXON_ID=73915 /ORGANISM="Pyrodinium bahamense, Strain pbaha01" /LENGTH=659 /DNA_ID=CAMNT_0020896861 /DNA_START=56 /DNA_END=2035 /DNA_ORIENTATION=+
MATQLTVTIPDGAPAGSILSIPVNGKSETIKARVPEGLGPGSTLVLTQWEGSDEWTEEVCQAPDLGPTQVVPGAVVGLDLNTDGNPDLIVAGPDLDRDGIPDALQKGQLGTPPPPPSREDPGLIPPGPVAYTVRLETSAGVIDIIVRPDWAPHGARRFLELAAAGDLDGLSFYRAVKGCLAQFGLPAKRQWQPLPDDPPTGVPFLLGAVCFAAVGKNSRKSTLFICIGDMSHCFGQSPWETPIGAVAEASLDVLDRIETIYGDIAECGGAGPNTSRINAEGNEYLRANFPLLTHIISAKPLDWPPPVAEQGCSASVRAIREPVTVATVPEPMVSSTRSSVRSQEPPAVGTSSNRAAAMTNGTGSSRMVSIARQKAVAAEAAQLHSQSGPAVGVPIDVPVEVMPSTVRNPHVIQEGSLTARGSRTPGGSSLVLDVPVEVCSTRPSRRSVAGSGAMTARSCSRGGILRVQQPSPCDSSLMLTPSEASSVSIVSCGLGALDRSVNVSFEQQAQAQAQVLQAAHAQAQAQACGTSLQMRAMQPQGQLYSPPLGSVPLGTYGGGGSMLLEQPPHQTMGMGSLYCQNPDSSFAVSPLNSGLWGLPGHFGQQQQQQQQLLASASGNFAGASAAAAAAAAGLQPPMSPLSMLPGLQAPPPLSVWPQR